MKAFRHLVPLVVALVSCVATAQDVASSVLTGIAAYNRGDIASAYQLLKAASDAGDSDAQVNLGYLYARGQGTKVDQVEAMRLYLLSAGQGNPEGMNAVGFKYRHGSGVKVDLPRAVHWLCRAAVSGDPRGLNNLAIMYLEGQGVERDSNEARRLWEQSAERGNPNAMFNLGQSYYLEPPMDLARGVELLRQAAMLGHGGAQKLLRQIGNRDSFPPQVNTEFEMRPARKDLRPGKVRDCGFLVS
jgi:TPR repeat protein